MAARIGIVGAGNIGRIHAQAAAWAGSTVAAICDLDPARAEALAALHPGAATMNDVADLLALDDLDAVVVAVPNHRHREVAVAALESGRDVLLEKPMALSAAECREIIATMDQARRRVQLGFVCRFAPAAVEAKRLIDEGRLGEVYHIKAFLYRRRGIPGLGKWFTTRAMSGGGALIDIGVHFIELALHLAGHALPQRVSAQCVGRFGSPIEGYRFAEMWAGPPDATGVFDVDDGVCGLIRCAGGLTIELNVTWAVNMPEKTFPEGLVVLGDRGGVYLHLWDNRLVLTTDDGEPLRDTEVPLSTVPHGSAWDRAWQSEHEHFRRVVEEGAAPGPSANDGLIVQQVVEAMYASSDAGREVEIG